jgi:hypothetical protein
MAAVEEEVQVLLVAMDQVQMAEMAELEQHQA